MDETELIRYGDAGPDANEKSDKDENETEPEEEKTSRRARTLTGILACIVACVVLATFIVLLVLMLVYMEEADEESHEAIHARNIHRKEVELAINNTAGSGSPWYEIMDVPDECLTHRILRWEVKHGFRPSSGWWSFTS